ncbi:type II toxin-antitoxin system VapC family toxin [Limnofasciculus baicalensis]|uniref:Type II toxin-antitoxin system VapC family toxin n=1 Tax=Limnofasciculus baicalensis BBK-W-15 TaxID=2699891 RepID=A0AAE3GUV3_9CYAN|nr:type II toxin-antitoxin system VapC family toxin [Limnofasciculus baicalensis]MCP2730497.1 type II toxin-antitoxin system VapC family toxin [Limnofasciculus baicalensis BBK-W-15]
MSALLLDTHTFIWFSENAPNLPVTLKEQIESADRVYLSIASLWEIAIKISIGKLTLQVDYAKIEAQLPGSGILLLPISFVDTVQVLNLPFHHRDPFDRILIAQAINHSLALVSRDEVFDAYVVQRLWV